MAASVVDLPQPVPDGHRVVLVHRSLRLHGENPIQVAPPCPPKCRAFPRRRNVELRVELRDIPLPQKAVGAFHGSGSCQPEFLRQASLPGSKAALRPAARLRRVARNHVHPQVPSSPAQPASGGAYTPFSLLSPSQESGSPGRCTRRKICASFRSPRASRPSPSASIPPPPTVRSRSHWWRHPESRSGHTTARRSASDACFHRCAAASAASAAAALRRCGPRLCRRLATRPAPCNAFCIQV